MGDILEMECAHSIDVYRSVSLGSTHKQNQTAKKKQKTRVLANFHTCCNIGTQCRNFGNECSFGSICCPSKLSNSSGFRAHRTSRAKRRRIKGGGLGFPYVPLKLCTAPDGVGVLSSSPDKCRVFVRLVKSWTVCTSEHRRGSLFNKGLGHLGMSRISIYDQNLLRREIKKVSTIKDMALSCVAQKYRSNWQYIAWTIK